MKRFRGTPMGVIKRMCDRGTVNNFDISLIRNTKELFETNQLYQRYDLASILKSIVYTALLRLDFQNKISLDDKVSKYISITGPYTEQLQIMHLVTNTCYFNYQENFNKDFLLSAGLQYPPGKKVKYGNTQSMIAGWILEGITGKETLKEALKYVLGDYFSDGFIFFGEGNIEAVQSKVDLEAGVPYDPIAKLFWERDAMQVGCAGLFGTAKDLHNFMDFFFTKEGMEIYKKIVNFSPISNDPLHTLGFIKRQRGYTGYDKFDQGLIMQQGYPGSSIYINPDFGFRAVILTDHRATPEVKNTSIWFPKGGPGKAREMYYFRRLLLRYFFNFS